MKKLVLFVDDEPNVFAAVQRIMQAERSEWDLRYAWNVSEAIDVLRRESIDVVVSDMVMPGKDGFELLAEMQRSAAWKDIPLVFLTGLEERDLKKRALESGAADLLSKPVDPSELKARIRSVLKIRTYQAELRAQNEMLDRKVQERTFALRESQLQIVWRLGKVSEYRDDQTGNHVVRVGCYSRVIAEVLGTPDEFVERVLLAGPLHDIGKIGVPDAVLLKPGRLMPEERETMKRHCVIGAQILRGAPKTLVAFQAWNPNRRPPDQKAITNPILEMAAHIAVSHHERWDGKGYPVGLSGESIPLEARIVALADAYDAMRSERPYKPALPEAEAVEIIQSEKGKHFDPEVCEAFERSVGEFQAIHAESSGDTAGEVQVGSST